MCAPVLYIVYYSKYNLDNSNKYNNTPSNKYSRLTKGLDRFFLSTGLYYLLHNIKIVQIYFIKPIQKYLDKIVK